MAENEPGTTAKQSKKTPKPRLSRLRRQNSFVNVTAQDFVHHQLINAKLRWEARRRRSSALQCNELITHYKQSLATCQDTFDNLEAKTVDVCERRTKARRANVTQVSLDVYTRCHNPAVFQYHRICTDLIRDLDAARDRCAEVLRTEKTTLKRLEQLLEQASCAKVEAQQAVEDCLTLTSEVVEINFQLSFKALESSAPRREQLVAKLRSLILERVHDCIDEMITINPSDISEGEKGSVRVKVAIDEHAKVSVSPLAIAEEIVLLEYDKLIDISLHNDELPSIRSKTSAQAAEDADDNLTEATSDFTMCQSTVLEHENLREHYEYELHRAHQCLKDLNYLIHCHDPVGG